MDSSHRLCAIDPFPTCQRCECALRGVESGRMRFHASFDNVRATAPSRAQLSQTTRCSYAADLAAAARLTLGRAPRALSKDRTQFARRGTHRRGRRGRGRTRPQGGAPSSANCSATNEHWRKNSPRHAELLGFSDIQTRGGRTSLCSVSPGCGSLCIRLTAIPLRGTRNNRQEWRQRRRMRRSDANSR